MGRLDELRETVGKAKCDRCGFTFNVDDLVDEEETGMVVCRPCLDETGFSEKKRDAQKEGTQHHFST